VRLLRRFLLLVRLRRLRARNLGGRVGTEGLDQVQLRTAVLDRLLREVEPEVFGAAEVRRNWGLKGLLELLVRWKVSSWDVLCLGFRKLGLVCVFQVVSWHGVGSRIMVDYFVQWQIRFAARIAASGVEDRLEVEHRSEVAYCQMQDWHRILVEVDIVEGLGNVAEPHIADCFDTVGDTVAVDFHSLIDSFQYFAHIQNYWCFDVGSFLLHRAMVHHLDLWMNHVLHDFLDLLGHLLVLLGCWIDLVLLAVLKMLLLEEAEAVVGKRIRPCLEYSQYIVQIWGRSKIFGRWSDQTKLLFVQKIKRAFW
jgi:hypothetical protein